MDRRDFFVRGAIAGSASLDGMLAAAPDEPGCQATILRQQRPTAKPIKIRMGGYAPSNTGFSLGLQRIGGQLKAKFGKDVEVHYVYNVMDFGYTAEDILSLVESGVLTAGYMSTSAMTDRVPELGIADLPFLFTNQAQARAATDGDLGKVFAARIEAKMDYRILGYFENGFRHISNRLRPIRVPADISGMSIRVLPSKIQARTFELLGAVPTMMGLNEAIERIKAGSIDAQENPFLNTVTYGVHKYHRFHTMTGHFYLTRPIFLHRASFDGWPKELQHAMIEAVRDAVAYQRDLHVQEEEQAAAAIRQAGGEIIELTPEQQDAFIQAAAPLHHEARAMYDPKLLALAGL